MCCDVCEGLQTIACLVLSTELIRSFGHLKIIVECARGVTCLLNIMVFFGRPIRFPVHVFTKSSPIFLSFCFVLLTRSFCVQLLSLLFLCFSYLYSFISIAKSKIVILFLYFCIWNLKRYMGITLPILKTIHSVTHRGVLIGIAK